MAPTKQTLTIIIKLGTSSIVSPSYPFTPHLSLLSSIVETVTALRALGHRVVLVSSGAIGVGLRRMALRERGKGLGRKQALAAVGQGRLIALWDNLFSQVDQVIAQVLLTRMDISDRTRYINAQNTFSELLQMGVVPIVNENDTVSVSEIKFGDNDTLSAITSAICHADYLFLLTDVECLYTDNPRTNPDAKPVRVVRDIAEIRSQVSTATLGTSLGTGGMSTKLIAAELATAAGTTTVIMHSEHVKDIFKVIQNGGPGATRRGSRENAGMEGGEDDIADEVLCTRFMKKGNALKDRKWWIAHGLHAAGSVTIDEGAYRAIQRKESGGRLLPAGVVKVVGPFASHQAVRIIVQRRVAPGLVLDTAGAGGGGDSDTAMHHTAHPSDNASGSANANAVPLAISPLSTGSTTSPPTPSIQPILSLSSSVASLDPLSRSVPPSPGISALVDRLGTTAISTAPNSTTTTTTTTTSSSSTSSAAAVHATKGEGPSEEWEEVEIGKGLAQYNSVEIDRIKGRKSSHIEKILGYNDCEHVVDSITFI